VMSGDRKDHQTLCLGQSIKQEGIICALFLGQQWHCAMWYAVIFYDPPIQRWWLVT